MTEANFLRAAEFTLGEEKGFVNDPDDPGGPTNHGITMSTLAHWRGTPVSVKDVQDLTEAEAKTIYREWWWKPLGCDKIFECAVAMALFDAGVLFGLYGSAVCAQRAAACQVPVLVVDGHIGPNSLAAINLAHPVVFLGSFKWNLHQRIDAIVEHRPKSEKFRKGWLGRISVYPDLVKLQKSTEIS